MEDNGIQLLSSDSQLLTYQNYETQPDRLDLEYK